LSRADSQSNRDSIQTTPNSPAAFPGRSSAATRNLLHGLKGRLAEFLMKVRYSVVSIRDKIRIWEDSQKHCCGDYSACPDSQCSGHQWSKRPHPHAIKVLRDVLAKGTDVIRQCKPYLTSSQAAKVSIA
jgi:hypothetical protein